MSCNCGECNSSEERDTHYSGLEHFYILATKTVVTPMEIVAEDSIDAAARARELTNADSYVFITRENYLKRLKGE